jgi:hypothetical protein
MDTTCNRFNSNAEQTKNTRCFDAGCIASTESCLSCDSQKKENEAFFLALNMWSFRVLE